MSFSPTAFFDARRDHLLVGADGVALMKNWLRLETNWRAQDLSLVRAEALARIRGDSVEDRHLALQALAFAGEPEDAMLLEHHQASKDLEATRMVALLILRVELTTDEGLADGVTDLASFKRFRMEFVDRQRRVDDILAAGYSVSDLRQRDQRRAVQTISAFLENATFDETADCVASGLSWRELARALVDGRDWQ